MSNLSQTSSSNQRFYSVEVSQALVARLTRVRFTVGPHLLLHFCSERTSRPIELRCTLMSWKVSCFAYVTNTQGIHRRHLSKVQEPYLQRHQAYQWAVNTHTKRKPCVRKHIDTNSSSEPRAVYESINVCGAPFSTILPARSSRQRIKLVNLFRARREILPARSREHTANARLLLLMLLLSRKYWIHRASGTR